MCVCVRARARAREARAVILTSESDFWEMRVLLGFAPVWLHGLWSACTDLDFLTFGKTCKILQACIHVLVKLIFRIRDEHKFRINSNGYVMRRNWRDEKISTQKILTFPGMSDHPSIDCCNLNRPHVVQESWRSPIVNQKTLIDLGSHSPRTKFYSLQHQLSELDLTRLTFFGVRYVLTYSPNHSSAQDVKHLDHRWSMKYWSDIRRPLGCLCATSVRAMLINLITYLET